MNNQVRITHFIWVVIFTLSSLSSIAAESKTQQADNLIKQWLSIEKQRNALNFDWRQQQPLLKQRLTLLTQEQIQLQDKIAGDKLSSSDVEDKRTQLMTSQNDMEANQSLVENALIDYYQLITELHPQLPPPLFESWQEKLSSRTTKKINTTEKLTTLLDMLEQLNDFDQRISHHQSIQRVIDESIEKEMVVRQLYMGLAQAWYVSLDGSLTGRGIPESSGWRWIPDEQVDSETILNAIAMIERKSEARILSLPVALKGRTFND